MKFAIGDIVSVEGRGYRVIGRITYTNRNDNCSWDEYRLSDLETNQEAWLSVDDAYKEYSISAVTHGQPYNLQMYHEVDRGTEVVTSRAGSVDVDFGESAFFNEYEDPTEELIISREQWSDGIEWSAGHYIDEDDFTLIRHDSSYTVKQSLPGIILCAVFGLFFILVSLGSVLSEIQITPKIRKYLKKSEDYSYETSVTGNDNRKAQVFKAAEWQTVDSVTKDIINGIEGSAQYVQQDDSEDNGAVAILTDKEYCVVYPAEDQSGVYVQVSDRKYAYTTESDLYRGSRRASHYSHRFYHYTGYSSDAQTYHNSSSPYSSYSGSDSGSDFSYRSDNSYNIYSNSVRQSSIRARQSAGGGLSGGK